MKRLISQELREVFFANRQKQLFHFSLVFIFNILAALLEGISFGLILLALTILGPYSPLNLAAIPALFHPFLMSLGQQQLFVVLVIAAIGLQILRSTFAFLAQLFSVHLGTVIQNEAQNKIYAQIFRLTFPCVSRYKVGDLVQYANTPSSMIMPLLDSLNKMIVSALTIGALTWLLMKISISLTGSVLLLFIGFSLAQHKIFKKIARFSKRFAETTANFSKNIVQNLHGMRPIHLFNRQAEILNEVKELVEKIAYAIRKLNFWHFSTTPINEIIGISLVGACLVLGPYFLKARQEILLPCLLTFITVTYRLATRVQLLMSGIGGMIAYVGQIMRLNEILKSEDKEFISEEGMLIIEFKNKIEYRNISLRYQPGLPYALQAVSCDFPRGSFTALVGASGAGKSSLIDLLLRLYDPSSGSVWIDGVELSDYSLSSWRNIIGVVSQDTFIFNETIEENIRFGLNQASREEVIAVAKIAGVHEFASRIPEGYQAVVGEKGYRLSGGERQRIALARVLLRKPQILVLDEATSSLDSHSEFLIQQAIETLQHQTTIIAIAHRLSTVVKADRILVLERGKVIEQGNHEELVRFGGRYAQFWRIQSIGGRENVFARAQESVRIP